MDKVDNKNGEQSVEHNEALPEGKDREQHQQQYKRWNIQQSIEYHRLD